MASNEQLIRAVQVATRTLASGGKFDNLLKEVLKTCVNAVGAEGGTIYLHDPVKSVLRFQHVLPERIVGKLPKEIADDQGVAGEAFQTRLAQISEFPPSERGRNAIEEATGVFVRTMITVPLTMEDEEPIGVVQLINKRNGSFSDSDIAVLDTVSAVSTMAYLNSQLLEESNRASTLLGMGKVSHDIGNLASSLTANLAFSDMVMEGIRQQVKGPDGERYVEMLEGMFDDLKIAIDRLVRYSQLISDLSAGRPLRPTKRVAKLSETVETAASYLETDSRKRGVDLRYEIETDDPPVAHDEMYLFRIIQNLVGNAIKAVLEKTSAGVDSSSGNQSGEVVVRYRYEDNSHIIEVQDSGPGMHPDAAERILAGRARSEWDKATGSGWGTKIVLELAATHDAEVTIDSIVGQGSLFRVVLPHS